MAQQNPFYALRKFTRVNGKPNKAKLYCVNGVGDYSIKMALFTAMFLKKNGHKVSALILSHADKRVLSYYVKLGNKIVGKNHVFPLKCGSAFRGNGKSLAEAVNNKPKWIEQVSQLPSRIRPLLNHDNADCLIHHGSGGGSSGILGDDVFRAIADLFEYKLIAYGEPTKDSEFSAENMPEILNSAEHERKRVVVNFNDMAEDKDDFRSRYFYLRNYLKNPVLDIANASVISAIAVGTLGGETEDLDLSDWFTRLPIWSEVRAGTNSNPHDLVFRPFPIPRYVPNETTTIQTASYLVRKLEFQKDDFGILIGDVDSKFKIQILNEAFVKGSVRPRSLQQFRAGISMQENLIGARLREFSFEKVATPNFDKSHEMEKTE